jgi:hypothetical protein
VTDGVTAADKTISRLITRMANRVFVDVNALNDADVSLAATQSSLPEYYGLPTLAARQDYHSRLESLVREGALELEWDRAAGERGQLKRVSLLDPVIAAQKLAIPLPWQAAKEASELIDKASAGEFDDITGEITSAWMAGKSYQGFGVTKAGQLRDAIEVVRACKASDSDIHDVPHRRLSAQLFGDSKRIEAIPKALAVISGHDCSGDHKDIFPLLGLVKYPQPTLVGGNPLWSVKAAEQQIPCVLPYVGLRPDTVEMLVTNGHKVTHLLTIENLTSFNEAAAAVGNSNGLLVIYTAGMPTPSFLGAYQRLLKSAQPDVVAHWGDIDTGGFRIAARMASAAQEAGHRLDLFRMNPAVDVTHKRSTSSSSDTATISALCEQWGWLAESSGLAEFPAFQEQEVLDWRQP